MYFEKIKNRIKGPCVFFSRYFCSRHEEPYGFSFLPIIQPTQKAECSPVVDGESQRITKREKGWLTKNSRFFFFIELSIGKCWSVGREYSRYQGNKEWILVRRLEYNLKWMQKNSIMGRGSCPTGTCCFFGIRFSFRWTWSKEKNKPRGIRRAINFIDLTAARLT